MIDDEIKSGLARIAKHSEFETRRFAADCCERLLHLFAEPMIAELLKFSRRRGSAEFEVSGVEALRNRADFIYRTIYPGYGEPSAAVCALCAAGEVAFTNSPDIASANALIFASKAIAKLAAEAVDDMKYDDMFEQEYGGERRIQLQLLQARLAQLVADD